MQSPHAMEADGEEEPVMYSMRAIGHVESVFQEKNGTPRQGLLCTATRARIRVTAFGSNSHHSLVQLTSFSHVWVMFIFHANRNKVVKPKIAPPRLGGKRVGVFASRSPHRPNPIGLSLCKLESVCDDVVTLSGIDLIEGTPVVDIKPYIPEFESLSGAHCYSAEWIPDARPPLASVEWSGDALEQLRALVPKMRHYESAEVARVAVEEVLAQDPRSDHWARTQTRYGFCLDVCNVVCDIDEQRRARIVAVEDWSDRAPKEYVGAVGQTKGPSPAPTAAQ